MKQLFLIEFYLKITLHTGLGKSPAAAAGDSGFVSGLASTMSSASKLATPIKSLFTSPNEKYFQEKKSSYSSTHSFSGKKKTSKRLFETSSQPDVTVFGVNFKLDEAIPVLVLVFVALSAVVTVTTLTSALR